MKNKICLLLILVLACVFVLTACNANDDKSMEDSQQYNIYLMAKDSGYTGTYDEWLASIKGADGINGREIELSVVDKNIVWRYVGATEWTKIYSVNDLIGPKGDKGSDGVSIVKTEINEKGELIVTYSDGKTANLGVVKDTGGVTDGVEHTFVKKNDDTYSWEECSKCGMAKNLHRHTYGNSNICTTCGHEMRDCFKYNLLADGTYSIGRFYTSGYPEIEKVVIPSQYNGKDITAIEDYAFDHNYYITDVVIPGSIKSIGKRAFCNCNQLVSVQFSNGIKHIASEAFTDCYKLSDIVIPESIESMDKGAFASYSVINATLPYCPDNIGEIFGTRNKLETVTFTGGTKISENVFKSFGNLKKVYIPESVTTIGKNAFTMCPSLVIYVEAKSKPAGWHFNWNSEFLPVVWDAKNNDVAEDGNIYINENGIKYTLKDGKVTIPNQGSSHAENVVVANSIKYKDVDYNVTSIENGAFKDFNSIKSITLPYIPAHIGDIFNGFDEMNGQNNIPDTLKEVILTGGTTIGDLSFSLCPRLENVTIPSTVTYISPAAFYGCPSITRIVVDTANQKYTSRDANNTECNVIVDKTTNTLVSGCKNSVIPDSVTAIGDYAFMGAATIDHIDIPSNVSSIGESAFLGCARLSKIIIPSSVINMGSQAFTACGSLTIHAEAPSQPSTWATDWNPDNRSVVWYGCDANEYTYTFNSAPGEQIMSITTKGIVDIVNIRPSKKGYYFAGWYDNEACTGSSVAPYYYKKGGATLYAKWNPVA